VPRSRKPRGVGFGIGMQQGLEPFASLSNGGRVGRREIGALKRLAAEAGNRFSSTRKSRSMKEHSNQRISGEGLIRFRCLELG